MREIEFKGKVKNNDEWIYGSLLIDEIQNSYVIVDNQEGIDREINPETIGQYTGLKDKNGKKIFEGDIVLYAENYKYIVCLGEHNKNPENCAEAVEVGFYLKSIKSKFMQYEEITPLYSIDGIAARFPKYCASDDNSKESIEKLELEAIGNIWDNPELLKEEL